MTCLWSFKKIFLQPRLLWKAPYKKRWVVLYCMLWQGLLKTPKALSETNNDHWVFAARKTFKRRLLLSSAMRPHKGEKECPFNRRRGERSTTKFADGLEQRCKCAGVRLRWRPFTWDDMMRSQLGRTTPTGLMEVYAAKKKEPVLSQLLCSYLESSSIITRYFSEQSSEEVVTPRTEARQSRG